MQSACAILPYAADPALQYFYTLSHKPQGFLKKVIKYNMCVLIFLQLLSEAFLILRRTERDMIRNVYCSSYKYPLF